eukprot:c8784_g1_i1.p1 GENE.c8784_g1_i1~~c8784_g1_i1.p1  ORF type:complete len:293 (+),score=68.55 c8784_g1_i1:40-918(+)
MRATSRIVLRSSRALLARPLELAPLHTPTFAPRLCYQPNTQMREMSLLKKLGSFVGLGGDKTETEKEVDGLPKEFNVESFFDLLNKLKMVKKMGMGAMVEKLVGGSIDSAALDKILDLADRIKGALAPAELTASSPLFSQTRRSEICTQAGISPTEFDLMFSMFARTKSAAQALDTAKKEGKKPQSIEEMRAMMGPALNGPPPSPTPPANTAQTPPVKTVVSNSPSSSMGHTRIRSDRFVESPKKQPSGEEEKVRYGRNDWVEITDGTETKSLKWKKAEVLVEGGRWRVVKK